MKILLLALILAQDSKTIPQAHKRDYISAADNCRKAKKLVESDPKEAVRLLTAILENSEIEERECRLRIEMRPGTYSRWYEFYPYHFRARAYLVLADKSAETASRIKLLEKSEKDFADSVSRNLPPSKSKLAAVREKLRVLRNEQLAAEKEPPFRKEWRTLLDEGRFTAAKAHVESSGGFLPAGKREKYLSDTKTECKKALGTATRSFYLALKDYPETGTLSRLSSSEFNLRFRLPDERDLVSTTYNYSWCRSVRSTLERMRSGEDVLQRLLTHGIEAIPMMGPLVFLEPLAWSTARDQVMAITGKAKNAPRKERDALRLEADRVRKAWEEFTAKVGESKMRGKIPARDFASLMARFPVVWEGAPATRKAIETGLQSETPQTALATVEKGLAGERKIWERLAIESRREIVRLQITAGALRILAGFESVEDAVEKLGPLGRKWKQLGGSNSPSPFGPRVDKVFRKLLR